MEQEPLPGAAGVSVRLSVRLSVCLSVRRGAFPAGFSSPIAARSGGEGREGKDSVPAAPPCCPGRLPGVAVPACVTALLLCHRPAPLSPLCSRELPARPCLSGAFLGFGLPRGLGEEQSSSRGSQGWECCSWLLSGVVLKKERDPMFNHKCRV